MAEPSGRTSFRRWLLRLHLIAGLTASVYAILIGVSGSILVFREELTELAYPEFHSAAVASDLRTSPDQVMGAARQAYPDWRPLTVTWPNERCPLWMIYLLRGSEALEVYVDPGSGMLAGSKIPSAGWLGTVASLHVNLMSGSAGRMANGIGALLLLGLSVTGVILWWPAKRFRINFRSGWRGWNLQTHHAVGVASAVFLALLGSTGGYFIWPEVYIRVVDQVLARTHTAPLGGHPPQAMLLGASELANLAQSAVPNLPIYRLELPYAVDQPVHVSFREGDPIEFHKVTTAVLDPVTGSVLSKTPSADRPSGDSMLAGFSVVHFGIFAGLPGRLLWSGLGLALPLMSVTGFLMWWRRIVEPRLSKPGLSKARLSK